MSDQPYMILHTHLTGAELRPHMQPQEAFSAYVVATLRARGFLLRSLDDYEGTLQGQVDGTTQGLWVRQILPRKERDDGRHADSPE